MSAARSVDRFHSPHKGPQRLEVVIRDLCERGVRKGREGNRFFGSLRTTIRWTRCPPEGAVYKIVLLIRGNRVVMLDAGGVLDSGLIQGNVMVLKDAYGRSVWRRTR